MKIAPTDVLAALSRSREMIDDVIRQTDSSQHRVSLLAKMLRSLWPSCPLYACLLQEEDHSHLCLLNEKGKAHSEGEELLRAQLIRPGKTADQKPAVSAKLPRALKLPGYSLLVEGITFQEHCFGVLGLAVPENASTEILAGVRTLLAVCGEQLASRLHVEGQQREWVALQNERQGQASLANAGELAGPLAHEFNNFLNVVLLHVALLEPEIPEKLRSELTEIRRQGASMTALVKQFQQYRRRQQPVPQRVDLNRTVRNAVGELTHPRSEPNPGPSLKLAASSGSACARQGPWSAVPLALELAPDLPPVLGSRADLKRLCTFLLTNAAAAAGPVGGSLTIRTESGDNRVLLRFEDTGPSLAPERLLQLFEPTTVGRAGTNGLELAACETLVRRLRGNIRGENRAEGGVVVIVELLPAPHERAAS